MAEEEEESKQEAEKCEEDDRIKEG